MRRKPSNKVNNNNRRRGSFRPDHNNAGKIKNVSASKDKYHNLAREAAAAGDRVEAENYLQHADHYFRVLYTLQEEDMRHRAEREAQFGADAPESMEAEENATEEFDEPQEDDSMMAVAG